MPLYAFPLSMPSHATEPALEVQELQKNVGKVWKRVSYSSYFPFNQDIQLLRQAGFQRWVAHGRPAHASLPSPEWGSPDEDDAFITLMQILHGKIASN